MYLWIVRQHITQKKNITETMYPMNTHRYKNSMVSMSPDAITMISYGLEPPKQIIIIKTILIILCIDFNYSPCSTKAKKHSKSPLGDLSVPQTQFIFHSDFWIRQPESIRRRGFNSLQTKNIVPKTLFWLVHHMSPLPRCPRVQAETTNSV